MKDDLKQNSQVFLSASVSCIDPLRYKQTVVALDRAGIDGFHFDICDGIFAPTFLLSSGLVRSLRPLTRKRFDVHLYCMNPSRYLLEFAKAGADLIVVHVEAMEPIDGLIRKTRDFGTKVGVGILPNSSLPRDFEDVVTKVDLVLNNTVGPAYSGQKFDIRGLHHAGQTVDFLNKLKTNAEVGIDGAVAIDRLNAILSTKATYLVLGTSSIFGHSRKPSKMLVGFRRALSAAETKVSST
jgi:ribulose-phosphate 3-epimerase